MTYEDLKENLLYYNKAVTDYKRIKQQPNTERNQEQLGFISGELYETTEMIKHAMTDTIDNFNNITRFLEEYCPNSFSIMIANLDSIPDKYETLYDICMEINIKNEDNFEFPVDCIKAIKIYK